MDLDLPIMTSSWASSALLAAQQILDPDGTYVSLRVAVLILVAAVTATWHFTRKLSKIEYEGEELREEIKQLKIGRRHTDDGETE